MRTTLPFRSTQPNAWVWLRGSGLRKLDDRNDDACTSLLAIAATSKTKGWAVSVHEEARGGTNYITDIYDFPNGTVVPTQSIHKIGELIEKQTGVTPVLRS